jgi:hypothetical protein
VLGNLSVIVWSIIDCNMVLRCLRVVVHRSLGVLNRSGIRSRVALKSFGGVARGRVILRGFGEVARGSISCAILWSLGGVVRNLGVVRCCICCCCVVRRRRSVV